MPLFDGDGDEERTEAASVHRREEFRRTGQVAISREGLSVILLICTGCAVYFSGAHMLKEFSTLVEKCLRFDKIPTFENKDFIDFAKVVATSWGWMYVPVGVTAVIAGLLAGIAQVGVYFTVEPLMPKWERLNPISGFQKLFSSQGLVEAFKAVLKVAIVGAVTWAFLKAQAPMATNVFQQDVSATTGLSFSLLLRLFISLMLTFAGLAALDYGFQRFQMEKKMKMTKREAKDEFKLREGDPLIKSRIKGLQRKIASRRMMEQVPKADVVVTNPTHFAVALKYDAETMVAPKVVAKGAGIVALKIKLLAIKNGVPVVENKPLARTLFKEMQIGQAIPRELYKAVAEVLAYVYQLKNVAQRAMA